MMDGVPSRVNVLFADSVQSWSMFFLQIVSYPGHGTRIARGFVRYKGEKGTSY